MLKAPLFKYRHIKAGDNLYSPSYDFTLKRIEIFFFPIGKFNKWNCFSYLDDVWQCIGAKIFKTHFLKWRIRTNMAPALPAGVSKRMFNFINAPSLLVEHGIVQYAPDG